MAKKRQSMSTRTCNAADLESNRRVVFKREVLVANPRNRYENQRFGIELEDTRGAGETYRQVYDRLREQGLAILTDDVVDYVTGRVSFDLERKRDEVRKQYGLV